MLRWAERLKGPGTGIRSAVTVRHFVYWFGRKEKIDVHVFNTVTFIWRKLTPVTPVTPGPMPWGHTTVLIGDTVYLWGGCPDCNVLYAFDVDAPRWFKPQVSGTLPEDRMGHSACALGKVMYIHGGEAKPDMTNDIYKLDTATMVWTLINTRGTPPAPSWCHTATIIGTKMFVCGGMMSRYHDGQYNFIRVFDTETNHWLNTPSPQLLPEYRDDHSAFTYNEELYMFGGCSGMCAFHDVWKFSPETFSWNEVEPKGKPPPGFINCCCMMGDRIIVFAGDITSRDLYVLDLSPSLKTLCKIAVIQCGLDKTGLPHNIRWELAAMDYSNSS